MTTLANPWPAPRARGPVDAVVSLPGSKSLTNRALVLAALADGPSVVRRALRSRDTTLMAAALTALGARVDTSGTDWPVSPGPFDRDAEVDCGLAGTVLRFVPPVAGLSSGRVAFDGDPHMRTPPSRRGAGRAQDPRRRHRRRRPRCLAVRRPGHRVGAGRAGRHRRLRVVPVRLGAAARGGPVRGRRRPAARRQARALDAAHRHDRRPAAPSRRRGRRRGAEPLAHRARSRSSLWTPRSSPTSPTPRPSSPSRPRQAGPSSCASWPPETTQAGDALRDLLARMGCSVTLDGQGLRVAGTGQIEGIDADLHDVGELTPVIAALCALAGSPSVLRGVAHIRGHETDRLAALARELGGLGADVTETDDGLALRPGRAARWPLPHLRRPPDGACRRGRRLGRRRRARGGRRHDEQDLPRLRRLLGPAAVSPGARRYGEEDQEHYDRPRRRTRPRTKERPSYDDARDGLVLTVDRGRFGLVVDDVYVTAMKARPLGRKGVVVGDRVRVVGDVSGDDGALARIVEVAERTYDAAAQRRRRGRRRTGDDRQRRPAGDRDRAGRPRAAPAADRPRPGGGVRRSDAAAALPHQGRPRGPRDAALDLPLARRALGGDPQGWRHRRAARPPQRPHQRAARAQRRRASRRWSTRCCPTPSGPSATSTRSPAGAGTPRPRR